MTTETQTTPPTLDELLAIRDQLELWGKAFPTCKGAARLLSPAIMDLCPHVADWQQEAGASYPAINRRHVWVMCPHCRAAKTIGKRIDRTRSVDYCDICRDTGTMRNPFTGELRPCLVCGPI